MVAILVLLTIITCLTIDYFAERAKLRHAANTAMAGVPVPDYIPAPQTISVRTPADLTRVPAGVFVGPGHAWMEMEPEGGVRLGVDRLPITLLGGIEEIDTVPAGTEVRQGDPLARLRHGERTIEVKSPVDGLVTEVNSGLEPGRLAEEPFGSGWIVKLQPREIGAALRRLFVAEEARGFLRRELANLRDYLAGLSLAGHPSVAGIATVTLPDGGVPAEGLAARMTDGEWRELVERFF
jgi:glycine cleavage system H lipoate-binding protein